MFAAPDAPIRPPGIGSMAVVLAAWPASLLVAALGLVVPIVGLALINGLGLPSPVAAAAGIALLAWVWRATWGVASTLGRGDWRVHQSLLRSLDPREVGLTALATVLAIVGGGMWVGLERLVFLVLQPVSLGAAILVALAMGLLGYGLFGVLALAIAVSATNDPGSSRSARLRALDRYAMGVAGFVGFAISFTPVFAVACTTLVYPTLLNPLFETALGNLLLVFLIWLWISSPAAPMSWVAEWTWRRADQNRLPSSS